MKSVNNVTLLGNLTRDPELRYTQAGTAVISFSIATNRSYKDKETDKWVETADFHNIVFWSKAAEIIGQYCFKGSKIHIQGRLQTRSWDDKDGTKKYKTEVVGRDFVLLTPKPKGVASEERPEEVEQPDSTAQPAVVPESTTAEVAEAEKIFGATAVDVTPETVDVTPGKPAVSAEVVQEDVNPDDIPF